MLAPDFLHVKFVAISAAGSQTRAQRKSIGSTHMFGGTSRDIYASSLTGATRVLFVFFISEQQTAATASVRRAVCLTFRRESYLTD